MLRITINHQPIDLSNDVSVSLNFENPFFSEDKIPTPYALNFEVPKTERNLVVLGRLDRLASKLDAFAARYDAEISFDGIKMVEGVVSVVEIKRSTIELTFDCAAFLDRFKNKLWQNDFGKISFGYGVRIDGDRGDRPSGGPQEDYRVPQANYFRFWEDQLHSEVPNFVAAPLTIQDYEWIALEEGEGIRPPWPSGARKNLFAGRINQRTDKGYMDKIIPAIRIGYLLAKIDPELEAALNGAGLDRLMLVCHHHPSYQTGNSGLAWTVDSSTLECYCRVSDFLPDITTAEFVIEVLKLVGGSLYTVGREPKIASNNEVIDGAVFADWTGKIVDGYTLSSEEGRVFCLSFDADTTQEESGDRKSATFEWWEDMVFERRWKQASVEVAKIQSTGQVFEVSENPQLSNDTFDHFDFTLLSDYPFNGSEPDETEAEVHEVGCKVTPVRNVVATELLSDSAHKPSFTADGITRRRYYRACEVEAPTSTRPTKLYVGSYAGLEPAMIYQEFNYPFISSDPFRSDGIPADGYAKFSQWIGKRRRVLRGDVRFEALDIQRLDLRRKVYFGGCAFLIRELSVTLKHHSIELADVSLVEC